MTVLRYTTRVHLRADLLNDPERTSAILTFSVDVATRDFALVGVHLIEGALPHSQLNKSIDASYEQMGHWANRLFQRLDADRPPADHPDVAGAPVYREAA